MVLAPGQMRHKPGEGGRGGGYFPRGQGWVTFLMSKESSLFRPVLLFLHVLYIIIIFGLKF